MARPWIRISTAAGSFATAAVLAVLAVYLGRQDLERADKIASVVGVLLNAAAVAIAVAGLALSWWMGRSPRVERVRQSIRAEAQSKVTAKRSQRASPGRRGGIDQEISGHGGSEIDASDAQSVGSDDV